MLFPKYTSLFAGDCDDFDEECGRSLTLAMCTGFKDIMAKKCPKMCNLCGTRGNIVACFFYTFKLIDMSLGSTLRFNKLILN